jgi:hypothetical protein
MKKPLSKFKKGVIIATIPVVGTIIVSIIQGLLRNDKPTVHEEPTIEQVQQSEESVQIGKLEQLAHVCHFVVDI